MIVNDPTFHGHARLTCTVDERAVVRQPYMSDQQWHDAQEAFRATHASCAEP